MSHLKKAINFKALESELDEALRADELYKLQNEAKFRAIEQRVPTYDHFADMVKAAHLKPLERSEMQKKAEVSWNHCYKCREIAEELSPRNYYDERRSSDDASLASDPEPRTSAEFLKVWSALDAAEDKFEFLLQFRDRLKDKFFKSEIPTDFLEDFFRVVCVVCSTDTALLIIYLLQTFTECSRFSLSLTMVSSREHSQLLFDRLLRLIRDDANVRAVKSLAREYGVILKAEL